MSNAITDDCSSGLHDYCTPCQCECHPNVEKLQEENENLKRTFEKQSELIKNLRENYSSLYQAYERLTWKLDDIAKALKDEKNPNVENLQLKIHNQEEMIKNLRENYTNLYKTYGDLHKKLETIKQTIGQNDKIHANR